MTAISPAGRAQVQCRQFSRWQYQDPSWPGAPHQDAVYSGVQQAQVGYHSVYVGFFQQYPKPA